MAKNVLASRWLADFIQVVVALVSKELLAKLHHVGTLRVAAVSTASMIGS